MNVVSVETRCDYTGSVNLIKIQDRSVPFYIFIAAALMFLFYSVSCSQNKLTIRDGGEMPTDTSNGLSETFDPNSIVVDASNSALTPHETVAASEKVTEKTSQVSEETELSSDSRTSPGETSAGTDTETEEADSPVTTEVAADGISETAKTLVGIPFANGGDNPTDGFDNSGFIYYILRQNGYVNCPRGVGEQSEMGHRIAKLSDLHAGDLIFLAEKDADGNAPSKAQFGGIYIGGGEMIYSPQPGQNVKKASVSSGYYFDNFFCGVRVS